MMRHTLRSEKRLKQRKILNKEGKQNCTKGTTQGDYEQGEKDVGWEEGKEEKDKRRGYERSRRRRRGDDEEREELEEGRGSVVRHKKIIAHYYCKILRKYLNELFKEKFLHLQYKSVKSHAREKTYEHKPRGRETRMFDACDSSKTQPARGFAAQIYICARYTVYKVRRAVSIKIPIKNRKRCHPAANG